MRLSPILALAALLPVSLPAQTTTEQAPLPSAADWRAALIHRAPGGVWYAAVAHVIPAYGAPDVIACDDTGQITVLSVYSGKWTARSTNPDNQWLAPTRPADVDPRIAGPEIYVGGRAGNVHRVVVTQLAAAQTRLDSVEIAHVPGEEFHTVLAADLDPTHAGDELLAFAIRGGVFALEPDVRDGDPTNARFTATPVATLPGRVRDAVVLAGAADRAPRIVGVSRSGDLLGMRLAGHTLETWTIAHEEMGLGRVARRPSRGGPEVLYVTRDDGVLLRFEERPDGTFARTVIFVGAQGLRGVAAGRFFADPAREAVAVYGYGREVQLVSRSGDEPWRVETIFGSDDQGHWLTVGELDGRNGTDELIATGFGGQVVLLARPPGYGIAGAAVDEPEHRAPAATPTLAVETAARGTPERPWRIAVRADAVAATGLSPLNYRGGFETKSMVYETLVRRGADGRIVPGLASAWRIDGDGTVFTFRLRDGATFHDGTPVTADAVAMHFRRWVGLPEHDWLRCNRRIVSVAAVSPAELRITLDRSYALLPELCAINPTAIQAPGALDREGRFAQPLGSGPFAFVAAHEDGRVLRFRRHPSADERFVDLVRFDGTSAESPLDALLHGDVDAVLGSYLLAVEPERADALAADPRFAVVEGPGSSMFHLAFRYGDGPTAKRTLRRRVAATIDRAALIRDCVAGHGDASTGWAAPSITIWPQGVVPTTDGAPLKLDRPLRLRADRTGELGTAVAAAIATQLTAHGIPTELDTTTSGDAWDLRVELTHGVPYDPYTTLVSRFLPPPSTPTAETASNFAVTEPELVELVRRATTTADETARAALFVAIQERIDRDAVLVPLFAPRRLAVLRRGMPLPTLDHDMYALDAGWLVAGD